VDQTDAEYGGLPLYSNDQSYSFLVVAVRTMQFASTETEKTFNILTG
jgi:hypothetical protein